MDTCARTSGPRIGSTRSSVLESAVRSKTNASTSLTASLGIVNLMSMFMVPPARFYTEVAGLASTAASTITFTRGCNGGHRPYRVETLFTHTTPFAKVVVIPLLIVSTAFSGTFKI